MIPEHLGGAHRKRKASIAAVGDAIEGALEDLAGSDRGVLRARRREKFLAMGKQGLE